jgi:hypothetical protein
MTLRNNNNNNTEKLDLSKLSFDNRASFMLASDQKDDLKEKFLKVSQL